jgi:hemolysin D
MKFDSLNDQHTFKPLLVEIEDQPTSPLGRALLWTIVALIVITILGLFIAKIDMVVSAKGKVLPSGEIKVVQPIQTGIVSNIAVQEGDSVAKGSTLMEIDPEVSEIQFDAKHNQLALLKVEEQRLQALIHNEPFTTEEINASRYGDQIALYDAMQIKHHNDLAVISEKMVQLHEEMGTLKVDKERLILLQANTQARLQRLEEISDLIAKRELDEIRNSVVEYEKQLDMKVHLYQKNRAQRQELRKQRTIIEKEYNNKLLEMLVAKQKEITELTAELDAITFQKSKQVITSPVDGHVGKLLIHTEGGVVTSAEKLMTIIPNSAPLVIKATVLNKDIGFIKKGMDVALKVETFNFQKYGLLQGEVKHISYDALEDERLGLVYEVLIKPKETHLIVEGEKRRVVSGMSVNAEFKVGKRRVIEFFIYPMIKYLDEGMSVR